MSLYICRKWSVRAARKHPTSAPLAMRTDCRLSGEEVVDDREHPEAPAIGEAVRDEVHRPRMVRRRRQGDRRSNARRTLTSTALPDRKALLAIKTPKPFVIHHAPLPGQQEMQAPIAEATPCTKSAVKDMADKVADKANKKL